MSEHRFGTPTQSSQAKLSSGPRPQIVPILMRSRTPVKEKLVPFTATAPLSPRRVNPYGLNTRQSPDVKTSLMDNSTTGFEKEPDLLGKRQLEHPNVHNTVNLVFRSTPNAYDPAIMRERELGHYKRGAVGLAARPKDVDIMHKQTYKRDQESSFRVHASRDSDAGSACNSTTVSPRAGSAVSPRVGGKNRNAFSGTNHVMIGTDPSANNFKSTPIYCTLLGTPTTSKIVVLPSSAERHVDQKGNSTLHELMRQKEAELRSPAPTGRIHKYDPLSATKRVIDHHAERLMGLAASAKISNMKRSLQPDNTGSIFVGTSNRDASRTESLKGMQGPPSFTPEPMRANNGKVHISRGGSARRPDNNIFGGVQLGSSAVPTPTQSPMRATGRRGFEGRSHMSSPIRKSGEWEP